MGGSPSLKGNILANIVRVALGFIFPLITFPYVSRVLGPAGIGQANFAGSIVAYFVNFSTLGIPLYGTREVAKCKDRPEELQAVVIELMGINLVSTVVAYALLWALVAAVPQFREISELITIMAISIAFTTLGMEWLFQGLERYVFITIRGFVAQVVSIALLFVLVRKEADVLAYGALITLASVGANAANVVLTRRYYVGIPWSRLSLKRHLKPVFTMFGMTLAIGVYGNFNATMLGLLSGMATVGYYAVAAKFIFIIQSMVTSVSTVLLPRSSHFIQENRREDFENLMSKAFRLLVMLALPSVVGLVGLRRDIILLFVGESFIPSSFVLGVMSLNVLVVGLSNLFGIQVLIPQGLEKITLKAVLLGVAVAVALNLLLMPPFAERGAAASIVLTELCITAYLTAHCRSLLAAILAEWKKMIPYAGGSALIALYLSLLPGAGTGGLPRVAASVLGAALIYAIVLVAAHDEFALALLSRARLAGFRSSARRRERGAVPAVRGKSPPPGNSRRRAR